MPRRDLPEPFVTTYLKYIFNLYAADDDLKRTLKLHIVHTQLRESHSVSQIWA